jgi:hypothetical protein
MEANIAQQRHDLALSEREVRRSVRLGAYDLFLDIAEQFTAQLDWHRIKVGVA